MATLAMEANRRSYVDDQSFFTRMAWILSGVIVVAFAQHAALGRVDIPQVPVWVHLHALVMLAWLALLVTQNRLAGAGQLATHRRLGRIGALLVCALVALNAYTSVMALALHRWPPFFSASYFLALNAVDAAAFAGLIYLAIRHRRKTETHRRLMIGGTIVILEPAFGRLLPMPLIGGEIGEWLIMIIQLGIVATIAMHDRRTLARVHGATIGIAATVVVGHVLVALAAYSDPVIRLAESITGGA